MSQSNTKIDGACIEWAHYRNSLGYGVKRVGRKIMLAHRIAWIDANGEIPQGLCVLHRCDNPPCINANHLFLGTRVDNNLDCMAKGRRPPPAGERNSGAKLNAETVKIIRSLQGSASQREIGRRFGLKDSQMSRIMKAKSWKHI